MVVLLLQNTRYSRKRSSQSL